MPISAIVPHNLLKSQSKQSKVEQGTKSVLSLTYSLLIRTPCSKLGVCPGFKALVLQIQSSCFNCQDLKTKHIVYTGIFQCTKTEADREM